MPHHTITLPESRTCRYIGNAAKRRGYAHREIPDILGLGLLFLDLLARDDPGLRDRIEIALGLPEHERNANDMEALKAATDAAAGDDRRSRKVGKKVSRAIMERERARDRDGDPILRREERERRTYLVLLIRAALERLEPEDRTIIHQCFYENLTVRRIAAETRTAPSTVGDRRKAAIRRLKAAVIQLKTEVRFSRFERDDEE
jgi:RNA polymerase sigma factor (sigma-70 family)